MKIKKKLKIKIHRSTLKKCEISKKFKKASILEKKNFNLLKNCLK